MSPEACRSFRERLGSLALGHLEHDEAAAVQAHVDGCAECRGELEELRSVAGLLELADVDRLDRRPTPPADLGDRILTRVRQERAAVRTERRRRRLAGAAAGLAAALVLALVLVLVPTGDGAERVAFGDAPPGVEAEAELTQRAWGVQVQLEVAGLPAGETYRVWIRRTDGEREPLGSFRGVDGSMAVTLATGIPRSECSGVGVSDAGGDTVMYAHLDPRPAG
jgi:hypothetical protein